MAITLHLTIIISVLTTAVYSGLPTSENKTCRLPHCYLDPGSIPGGLSPSKTPQIVLFTYTGAVTSKILDVVLEIFPKRLKNPNGCPIGITSFVVTQDSDDCSVNSLYTQGHEIGIAGVNRTGLAAVNWTYQISTQLIILQNRSGVERSHIAGMRAPTLKPGGDDQFVALIEEGLFYDSSLLAEPASFEVVSHRDVWPFTLDQTLEEFDGVSFSNPVCPAEAHDGVWEIPVSSLLGTRLGKPHACTFIEDCISDLKSAKDVTKLLRDNFMRNYKGNRAPFQVNLQAKTLDIGLVVEGLTDFVYDIWRKSGVWIVTNQDGLAWIRNPVTEDHIVDSELWKCPSRNQMTCEQADGDSDDLPNVTVGSLIDVNKFLPWQTVVLAVLYFVVYRYDRYTRAIS